MQALDEKQMTEWIDWQCGVVDEIRTAYRDYLGSIDSDDVDWEAWLPLFLEGCSPRRAVDKAFVRH